VRRFRLRPGPTRATDDLVRRFLALSCHGLRGTSRPSRSSLPISSVAARCSALAASDAAVVMVSC